MFGVNTYIVWDEESLNAAVIDPGMIDPAEENVIDTFIKQNNLKVVHLINTHLHLDHTFGVKHIGYKYNVILKGHYNDYVLGEHIPAQARAFGIECDGKTVIIDQNIKEGDKIMLGEQWLEVIHVPGHSPGSIVLYSPNDKFLISGDVLFKNSIGRSDLAGGNAQQLISNIQTKLLTLPDDTIVYPGHGPSTTIGNEKIFNPYIEG